MFLKALLAFVPLAVVLDWMNVNSTVVFVCACLAIIPLADLLADFTEQLAEFLGPNVGGIVSGTLGNAPELIISGFALSKGLTEVVKASISGSILMNLLLALGVSMIAGGVRFRVQLFDMKAAGMASALLTLAAVALIVPAGFRIASPAEEEELSLGISAILLVMYFLSLVFTLTAPAPAGGAGSANEAPSETTKSKSGIRTALLSTIAAPRYAVAGAITRGTMEAVKSKTSLRWVFAGLGVTAAVLAYVSEIMTDALDPAIKTLGFSELFAGVIVVASLGNAAELITAVRFARADKLDLAISATVGSATQVALVVAPVLVIAGFLMGQPMNLLFSPFEVLAVGLGVLVISQITRDGESDWIEGAMLVSVYLVFAIGFYFLGPSPDAEPPPDPTAKTAPG
jgi:Ca2+:H+ antiporter